MISNFIVNYLDNWMPVSRHPHAKIHSNYLEPYLYCLNTSSKTIQINEHVFSDWDEIFDNDIKNIQKIHDIRKSGSKNLPCTLVKSNFQLVQKIFGCVFLEKIRF